MPSRTLQVSEVFLPRKLKAGVTYANPFAKQGRLLITTNNKKFYFRIDKKLFEKRSIPMKKLYV